MEASAKVKRATRGKIRQAAVLDMCPHPFVRIEVRSIAGKPLRDNLRVLRQIPSDVTAPVVNVAAVPDNRELARNVSFELPKEPDRVGSMNVFVVGKQGEAKPEALAFRADSDSADGRDAVPAVPAVVDKGG
jgi:hypothetical protein